MALDLGCSLHIVLAYDKLKAVCDLDCCVRTIRFLLS